MKFISLLGASFAE